MSSDSTVFCPDNIENWLESMEEHSIHSPLVYTLPTKGSQQSLKELRQYYLRAPERQRALIRSAVSDKRGVLNQLLAYVYRSAEQVRVTKDVSWLRIGVAAASIQGGRLDYRDFLLALAELYVAAEEVGLDPESEFNAVGGEIPADFHTYAVVGSQRTR